MSAAGYRGYAELLAQVLREPCNRGLLVRMSWVVGVSAVGLFLLGHYVGRPLFGAATAASLGCSLMLLWAGAFLKSAIRQNLPSHACLVPQLRRRLMVLTAVAFLLCALCAAIVITAFFGHFGYALLASGVFCTYMLFAQRYPWMAWLPSLIIIGSMSKQRELVDVLRATAAVTGEPLLTLLGLPLMAALWIWCLGLIFPRGGDAHCAWLKKYNAMPEIGRTKAQRFDNTGLKARWMALWNAGQAAALRRDSQQGATPGRMLMHTLGPAAHEGSAIAMAVLLAAATIVLVWLSTSDRNVMGELVRVSLMPVFVMMACVKFAGGVARGAVARSGEQGLYLLAPGAPWPSQLNRLLARTVLLRFLRVWLVGAACAVSLDVATSGQLVVPGPTFVIVMTVLSFAFVMLRNFAVMPAAFNETAVVACCILVAVVYAAILFVEQLAPGFPWFWAGSAIGAANALGLWLCWRRLMSLPAMLPAGRLAA